MKENNELNIYFITYSNRYYKGGIIGWFRKLFAIPNEDQANLYVEAYTAQEALQSTIGIAGFFTSNYTDVEIALMSDVKLLNNRHKFTRVYAYETPDGRVLKQIDNIADINSIPADAVNVGLFTDIAYFKTYNSHGY